MYGGGLFIVRESKPTEHNDFMFIVFEKYPCHREVIQYNVLKSNTNNHNLQMSIEQSETAQIIIAFLSNVHRLTIAYQMKVIDPFHV